MPPLPTEVKYHPSSVDNLVIRQLLQQSNAKNLQTFLQRELQGELREPHRRQPNCPNCPNHLTPPPSQHPTVPLPHHLTSPTLPWFSHPRCDP